LLLDAYGREPDVGIVRDGIERMGGYLAQMREFAADGSAHEIANERRGQFDELDLEMAWVEQNAEALVES
jgi:hypothetical protein